MSNRVSRRQASRWAGQEQPQQQPQEVSYQQPPAAAAPAQDDVITQIKEWGELKSQGLITEEEFAAKKAELLAR